MARTTAALPELANGAGTIQPEVAEMLDTGEVSVKAPRSERRGFPGGSYPERACVDCSFGADQVVHAAHLNARDTTLVYASRAPQAEIRGLKERMGWEHVPWYTITDDFDKGARADRAAGLRQRQDDRR